MSDPLISIVERLRALEKRIGATEVIERTGTTFPNALTLPEISTPSTPASGYGAVYFKSDGGFYALNDAGTEVLSSQLGPTSFTPTFEGSTSAGSWTYGTQAGRYLRIGWLCFFRLSLGAATRPGAPTGNALITGLPFTSANVTNGHVPVTIDTFDTVNLLATTVQLTARIPPNKTYIEFIENPDNGAVSFLPATSWAATSFIRISGWYEIA